MAAISRRQILGLGAGLGAAAVVGVPFGIGLSRANPGSTGLLLPSSRPLPALFSTPLILPATLTPELTPDGAGGPGGTDRYRMVQQEADVEILPGTTSRIWGYNGTFPGPTLTSRAGTPTVVTHTNRLPVPTVAHLHGGRTPPDSDGYPTDLVLPTGWHELADHTMPGMLGMPGMVPDPLARISQVTRDYTYPMIQRAATLWYHDHRMDFTGASIWRGLAGFHLVHDDQDDQLPLPRGHRDLPIMLTDRSFGADAELLYPSLDPQLRQPGVTLPYRAGVLGDVILVNGRPWPAADVDAARYRLRILNASNARRYRLTLDPPPPAGSPFTQIASDQGLLEKPQGLDAIEIAPAERMEAVIDFGAYPIGTQITVANEFGDGLTRNVMRFTVARRAADDTHIPDRLATVDWPDPAQAVTTRTFAFRDDGNSTGWTINGQPFTPTTTAAAPALGSTEIWQFVSDFHHPIHLHLVAMRVLQRGIDGPAPRDAGLKDVIDLRPAERVSVAITFTGYPGRYVFHCHNLEHEDMAMMGNFTVT